MARLRSADLERLHALLQRVYEHRDLASFRAAVVPILAEAVPSDFAACTEVDPVHQRSHGFVEPHSEFIDRNLDLFAALAHQHPLIAHALGTEEERALRISDVLSDREFRSLGIYTDFYRHLDVGYQLAVAVPAPRPTVIGLVVSRARTDFSDHDREALDLLRPHLVQAYQNAAAVSRLAGDREGLARALDDARRGTVLLSAAGTVRFASPHARACLERYLGRCPERGRRLPDPLWRWLRQRLLDADGERRLGSPLAPLVLRRPHGRLVVRTTLGAWHAPTGGHADGAGEGGFVLVLEEERDGVEPLRALGLTPREAEVLRWVAEGKTNAEIGTILGISARTVQKHVEAIFRELGVETRAAATRVALDTVRRAEG